MVFDSPVKTPTDIKEAINLGLHMNLDNELEVSIVAAYLTESGAAPPVIGLRINPVVGAGQIAMMSTASKLSKFGLPLMEETQDTIVKLYKENPWLTGI